jgi:membrane carboxypeptidase/penicillin-binding protein PbpC
VGNADNASMYHVSGISGAGPIWHDFMTWALKGRPPASFERPEGLVEVEVCALSGLLPTHDCPHKRREWFIEGTEPERECDLHQRYRIDTATGLLATEQTPPERVRERVYAVYPPEAVAWAIGQGLPQPPPAPEERVGGGEETIREGVVAPLEIVSPFQNDRYRLSASLPREDQRLMIEARAGGQAVLSRVTLYVDGLALVSFAAPPYQAWWVLEPGEHQIHAVGETAAGQVVSEAITVIVSK